MSKRPRKLKAIDGGKSDNNSTQEAPISLPGARAIPISMGAFKRLLEKVSGDPDFDVEKGMTELLFTYRKGMPYPDKPRTFHQSSTMGITQHDCQSNIVYYGAHFIYPGQEPSKRGARSYPSHVRALATLLTNRPDIEHMRNGTVEWYEVIDLVTDELHVFYRIPCVVKEGQAT